MSSPCRNIHTLLIKETPFWFGGFIVGNDVYHLYESPVIPIGGDGIPCLDITGFNLSNNVDAYDTVYVTGVLEFPTLSNEKIKRKQSDQCFLVDYVLRIIEIHL